MAQVEEENILIAERVPPGDNWALVDNKKDMDNIVEISWMELRVST